MNATLPDSLAQLAEPPIFVVGFHRSGTTWTFDMLTAHPQAAGVFESGIFAFGLGFAPLFNEEHWYEAKSEGDEPRRDVDRSFFGSATRLYQLVERVEVTDAVRELSGRWLARALRPGDRFLVEKTPQHLRTMKVISEIFPGAAFVHVIRDVRDVIVSSRAAADSWPGTHRQVPAGELAMRWTNALTAARADADGGNLRYLEVRFEEMRRDPAETLRRLFEFCRLPADEDLIARICERTSLEKLRVSAFRRRGEIGEWRRDLDLRDRLRIARGAGEMLIELGYEQNRAWWLDPRARLVPTFARGQRA